MPPKAAKKPAVLAAEALQHWSAQEAEWFKAKIILQHSLRTARRYLEREQQMREELVDRIQREAERRESTSAHNEERRMAAMSASRDIKRKIATVDERLVGQDELLHAALDEKHSLADELQRRSTIAMDERQHIQESVEKVERLLARLREKIVRLRRREALAASLEQQGAKLLNLAVSTCRYPFEIGNQHYVFFGDETETTQLIEARLRETVDGAISTRVLTPGGQSATWPPKSGDLASHRNFVTALDGTNPTPALHFADVLHYISTASQEKQWILIVNGTFDDPRDSDTLTVSGVRISLKDLLSVFSALKHSIFVIEGRTGSTSCRGWATFKYLDQKPINWRQRLKTQSQPDVVARAFENWSRQADHGSVAEEVVRGVNASPPFAWVLCSEASGL